jgi:3-methyladenine DNA glycosylase/8-oxoguanine DNA glycosylase
MEVAADNTDATCETGPVTTNGTPTRTRERRWAPGRPVDLGATLGPMRRGSGDPTFRYDGPGSAAAIWRTTRTPAGPATLRVAVRPADGEVVGTAWGPGATWTLDQLPVLLGADDDPAGFLPRHPVLRDTWRARPGWRVPRSGRVLEALLPAVLEQKVTGVEARRSWRELCWRFGEPAPGPAPAGMRVPPTPAVIRTMPDWEWHRAGVDNARRRAILAAAAVAHRLEAACTLGGEPGRQLLRRVPGIGIWTAAEVAQRAWGDPDAVSFGDFHIPTLFGWALLGRPLDDVGMLAVLAPYAPQRQRAVRYIEVSGFRRPRFGPRFSPKDYRAM